MATADPVSQFVRDALLAGRTRPEIREALLAAGWSTREVEKALAEFSDSEFMPPVPRPRSHVTAREVFIYALLFTALAFTATNLVELIHNILNIRLPDSADNTYAYPRAVRQLRWAIANLAVSTPLFIWMTIYTDRQIRNDKSLRRSLVRKWLTYIALFISALVFFGDATYSIYTFLNGEVTLRFVLKAATVAFVSAAVFAFYLRDIEARTDDR
jgi:hypothetical protein